MPKNIHISKLSDTTARCDPASYLNKDFKAYLAATRDAGFRFDPVRKCQVGPIAQVPEVMESLTAAGFTPRLINGMAEALRAVAQTTADPMVRVRELEVELAKVRVTLYPFQRVGTAWLLDHDRGLLHDDMGLGKTLQYLLSIPQGGCGVVASPAAVKGVHARECRKFRPDLTPVILSGRGSFRWPKPGELVIVNYDILPDHQKRQTPDAPEGVVLVADEAHALKSFKAQRTKRFRALARKARDAGGRIYLLTGTPILNRPSELWGILQAAGLGKRAFDSYENFTRIMGGRQGQFGMVWDPKKIDRAKAEECLRRVALGRRKADVLPDLPAKRWEDLFVEVDADTMAALDQLRDALKAKGVDISQASLSDLARPVEFESMAGLRAAVARAKIPALMDQVQLFEDNGEPLVVFSAHRDPIDALSARPGWAVITGDTPNDRRTQIEDDFQAGKLKGIAGTIGAMGTGLTLTHAARMLFVDLAWTPALNAQAEDRICRVGQDRGCIYTTLRIDHELEARIHKLLATKQEFVEGAVEVAVGDPTGPTKKDLLEEAARTKEIAPKPPKPKQAKADPNSKEEGPFKKLVELLQKGKDSGLKWPSMTIKDDKGVQVTLTIAGARSKHPGALYVKDHGRRGARFFGWIFPNGQTTVADEKRLAVLDMMASDSGGAAKISGNVTGMCCFCGRGLNNEESIEQGYGPICAKRYGLAFDHRRHNRGKGKRVEVEIPT